MYLASLELRDFRRYDKPRSRARARRHGDRRANGAGKTTLLEAVAWVALGRSFRGVPDARAGPARLRHRHRAAAVVDDGRAPDARRRAPGQGRNRVVGERAPTARPRDRSTPAGHDLRPDDLAAGEGRPVGATRLPRRPARRLAPRYEAARADYDRVLRHRNALLKGGVRGPDAAPLSMCSTPAGPSRCRAGPRPAPARRSPRAVDRRGVRRLAGRPTRSGRYEAEWAPEQLDADDRPTTACHAALGCAAPRSTEGSRSPGPHRDEWRLILDGLDTRTHASQGEQRCLALALRLAGHAS